jgi:2-keto-4-pentenoate hydratase/2-oxohepta-3-ene-1,7-dioic acid hydratase in catechol pathway
MKASRRTFLTAVAGGLAGWNCSSPGPSEDGGVKHYVRYESGGNVTFGELADDMVYAIEGDLFGSRARAGEGVPLSSLKLLHPIEPSKVLALAGNYRSHLGNSEPSPHPEVFFKPITSLLSPEERIVFPEGAKDVHYEGEFVIVVGKEARRVPPETAMDYILGYTCGNDISERNWQNGSVDGPENMDMQWWRAKGADTFSPLGPSIVVGLEFEKSILRTRLNGEVKQEQSLNDLIAKPAETVSFISHYVTLLPGDLIYTGTPGRTSAMKPGDVVEIEIDGIGILRNTIA